MIDRDTGLLYCGSDEEFYASILADFAAESGEKTACLEAALKEQSWEKYKDIVHTLKSTSKIVGAVRLSELASLHQQAAMDGDIRFITDNYPELIGEYRSVIKEIDLMLNQNQGSMTDQH